MRQVFGRDGIPTFFKLINMLRQLLVNPKDPVKNHCGTSVRVRSNVKSMRQHMSVRLKAMFNENRRPSSTTSEVAKHIHVDHPHHSVELENTEILERIQMI